jgi:DNA repair protein RadC
MKVNSENETPYAVKRAKRVTKTVVSDDAIIAQALEILEARMKSQRLIFTGPNDVKNFLKLKLGQLEHEVFAIMFLDSQHQLIAYEEMFRGTVSQTSVYPREIAKQALKLNSSAVILCHNHPSGNGAPSRADEALTKTVKQSLDLIDTRVLDHFIVAGASNVTSMAELGLV